MSITYKTPASFADFSCLGGKCEDTCCRNWKIKLDRQHFDLLKDVMSKQHEEKSMFEQYIRVNDSSITSDHDYAFIRMGVNGYCAMLDSKGLCSIHANHGVKVLGNVCTMFPRVISRCDDTIELSGALSCPEVVRNCIEEKLPLKLKRFKPSDLPRSKNYPIQRESSNLEDDYYSENFSLVRNHIMGIMADEIQSLETRLYTIANLAYRISTFYHRGCNKPNKDHLEAVLAELSEKNLISKLDAFINDYSTDSSISMIVVHSILSIKLQQANIENTSQLYEGIIQAYAQDADNENMADVLAQQLINIRNTLDKYSQQNIDKAVTRYIINCLYREWFTSMPDPFTYIQMLLVRTSILRTLIYLYVGQEDGLDQHELKQKIVYVMYNFARNIDQNLEFLKVIYNALSEQTMMTFDYSPAFIRIY